MLGGVPPDFRHLVSWGEDQSPDTHLVHGSRLTQRRSIAVLQMMNENGACIPIRFGAGYRH